MNLGPDILQTHHDALMTWWDAGGWRNGASWLIATGQIAATNAEKRDLVIDRLASATKEAVEFLGALPLA